MAKSFIYVNADGFNEESDGAFEQADFTATSAGVANAGDPILLDGAGKLDSSLIDLSAIDHGGLGGLGDDDHTIYTLADGTRAFTGDQSMGGNQLTSVGDPTTLTIDSASDDAIPMSLIASTANGEGASLSGIEDSAGYFTSDNVEGALAELFESAGNAPYTADGSGVAKGDLVYISANDTVSTSAVTTNSWSIGLARSTAGAAAAVSVTSNDQILTGVLTGATAGDTYFWSGTAHSTTIPATSGAYVWKTGVAANATDLHVEVEFIKKSNA